MTVKIGFIGAGRMAGAMIAGLIAKNVYSKDEIIACAPTASTRDRISSQYGIAMYEKAEDVVSKADVVVLGVKPKHVESLFLDERPGFSDRHLLISIVAGITISSLKKYVPDTKIIRVMPNHCCMVLEGASGYVGDDSVTDDDMRTVDMVLSALGTAVVVKESDMDGVTGVSGSSPAYMYMMIRAIADSGVKYGLTEEAALKLAAQSMIGAGKMVLESGMTPEQLVDGVCSPGGTTIEGVKVLEKLDFHDTVMKAINASIDRSIEMSRQ